MSQISSDADLLQHIEQAEKDLAMYAAIIGFRPAFAPLPQPAIQAQAEIPEPNATDLPHQEGLSSWMRHVSDEAKKRIREARSRLES